MKPIAIVQHERSVPPGLVRQVFDENAIEHLLIEAWEEPLWPAVGELGGLVVMGGTMNVDQLDDFPFLKVSRELMASALEAKIPTLGVCLGSQMMARVLGAPVRRAEARNALFSPLDVSAEGARDPLLSPFVTDVDVLQFHEDTFTVPADAVPLATSRATGLAQAFRYGEQAYAVQFHFEVHAEVVRRWVEDIGRAAMESEWNSPDGGSSLQSPELLETQEDAGRRLLQGFLDLVRPS